MGVAKVIACTRTLQALELMRLCGEKKPTRPPVLSSVSTLILTDVSKFDSSQSLQICSLHLGSRRFNDGEDGTRIG
jgi:hypothetical protein